MDHEKRDAFVAEFRTLVENISGSSSMLPYNLAGGFQAEAVYTCAIVPLLHIVFEQGERIDRLEDQVIGLLGG